MLCPNSRNMLNQKIVFEMRTESDKMIRGSRDQMTNGPVDHNGPGDADDASTLDFILSRVDLHKV